MHWILQSNIYSEEGFKELVRVLERLDLPYSTHKCVPFAGTLEPEPEPTQSRVIVMGSYTLALQAQKRGWEPGIFTNFNFNFRMQLEHWGENMHNAGGMVWRIADVPPQKQPFFIRPVGDGKDFTGKVMDWGEFEKWRDQLLALGPEDRPTVDCNTIVLVAPAKEIYAEYRTWIVDRKVITSSQYKLGRRVVHNSDVPKEVEEFATYMARTWAPHRAFVLDVFLTPNGLKIGEVNCLNAAGFYAANMGKLVMALEDAFGEEDQ